MSFICFSDASKSKILFFSLSLIVDIEDIYTKKT